MLPDELSAVPIELIVDDTVVGLRLDAFLADKFNQYSRMQLRKAINNDGVLVNGRRSKAAHRLHAGEHISISLPSIPRDGPTPEPMELDILFEDSYLVAINKPPGLVVHPGKGHRFGTLVAGLRIASINSAAWAGAAAGDRASAGSRYQRRVGGGQDRPGAPGDWRPNSNSASWRRSILRSWPACPITTAISSSSRSASILTSATRWRSGPVIRPRAARTFYEVERRFLGFAAVKVLPKTGRTHQIRLHLAHLGCPVLCDKLYGGRSQITVGEIRDGREDGDLLLDRQALHARRLKLTHPITSAVLEFQAPLPADLVRVLTELERYRSGTTLRS